MDGGPEGKEKVEALDVPPTYYTAFLCTVVAAVAATAAAQGHYARGTEKQDEGWV